MMAYRYIENTYGLTFKMGQRVEFTEDGRCGTVMRVRGEPYYVKVRFDDGTVGNCHPMSVVWPS